MWMTGTMVTTIPLCSGTLTTDFSFCSAHPDFIASMSFLTLKLSITFADLLDSTHLAHVSTCLLDATVVSVMAVNL